MEQNGLYSEEYGENTYMEQEDEWEREGLLDPAWEKQQKKVSWYESNHDVVLVDGQLKNSYSEISILSLDSGGNFHRWKSENSEITFEEEKLVDGVTEKDWKLL